MNMALMAAHSEIIALRARIADLEKSIEEQAREIERWKERSHAGHSLANDRKYELTKLRAIIEEQAREIKELQDHSPERIRTLLAESYGARSACDILQGEIAALRAERDRERGLRLRLG